jgi:hypothetical protein
MSSEKLASFSSGEIGPGLTENEQVMLALRPRAIGGLLERVFGLNAEIHGAGHKPLACHILDTKYEPGDYCRVLYQLGDNLAIGMFHWGKVEGQIPVTASAIPALGMQAYLFPQDPALPGLTQALDPEAISAALSQHLPELQSGAARILRCKVTVLRFRPGRRCTLRLDLWLKQRESGGITKRVFFGKVYHDLEKASSVYHEMLALSSSIQMQDGRIALASASLFLPELAMVLQDPIAGEPLDSYLDCDSNTCTPRCLAGFDRAAVALAALHTSGLSAGRMRSIEKELVRFKKRAEKIGQVNPGLGMEIAALADSLARWLSSLEQWGAGITLVHGDCKPAQFLISQDQIALLDFDHCGMADPAGDVGTFLATLQQMQLLRTLKDHGRIPRCSAWLPGLKQQFLQAYCQAGGYAPSFELRAVWYEAVGLLRKAIRSFERSPFSPVPSALVTEAAHRLEGLPAPV